MKTVILAVVLLGGWLPVVHAERGQAGVTGAPAAQVYANQDLHLTYSYPSELKPIDGAFAVAVGRRLLYGEDADSEQARRSTCTKLLLSVGKGSEGNGTWVKLGVLELSGPCFPVKVFQKKKATETLLRNLVEQGTTVMGMMPLEQPAMYGIEGRTTSFAAAQGTPVTGSDLQTAGDRVIGVVAMAVEERVVTWVVETNEAGTFNRLLGSGVDFGLGKAERLFPGVAGEVESSHP